MPEALHDRINRALRLGVDDAARVLAQAQRLSLRDARNAVRRMVVVVEA